MGHGKEEICALGKMVPYVHLRVWACRCPVDASWTWRKILKLRNVVIQFIRYIVGNGKGTFIWHDNWYPFCLLKLRFGTRVIYNAASNEGTKLDGFVTMYGWNMPCAISYELIIISNSLPSYQPNVGREDSLEYVLNANKLYTVKSTWNGIRNAGSEVLWYNIFGLKRPSQGVVLSFGLCVKTK